MNSPGAKTRHSRCRYSSSPTAPGPRFPNRGGTTYTFVTEGIETALDQARTAAAGQDVLVVGGANVARQYLQAGLLDEIQIHLVPILLGHGVRLFEGTQQLALEPVSTIEARDVTHLSYRASP